MRTVFIVLAASGLMAAAGSSLADTPPAGDTSGPATGAGPDTSAPPSSAAPSDSSAAPSAGSSASSGAASSALSVGEPVKDNTGATIGQITDLKPDSSGQQTAVIKMGAKSFQVAAANLGVSQGAAVINLTQSQINDMLKAKTGGQ